MRLRTPTSWRRSPPGTTSTAPAAARSTRRQPRRRPSPLQPRRAAAPAQVKSALESTGDPVKAADGLAEAPATREGGGRIDLTRADVPLLFSSPTGIAFGLAEPGGQVTRTLALTDAGGGAGDWAVSI